MIRKILVLFIIIILFLQVNNLSTCYPPIQVVNDEDISSNLTLNTSHIEKSNSLLVKNKHVFTKNLGQISNEEILFYDQSGSVWFTDDGVWFDLREEIKSRESIVQGRESRLTTDDWLPMTYEYKRVILKQGFVGANDVRPVGRKRFNWNSNFFYGNNSSKWYIDVPNYAEVFYENLFDGIDLRYYSNERGLKYDFIVHPGGDPNQIKMKYHGIKCMDIDKFGNLVIQTEIQKLIEYKPIIYQVLNGNKNYINGEFFINNCNNYAFNILEEYQCNEILVIDPIVNLEYSTFFGGSNLDFIIGYGGATGGIEVDTNGNAFITGGTNSQNFPTTPGVFNEIYSGVNDVFVLKMNQNGSGPFYSTFIGGNQSDGALGITLDTSGNAFIVGTTISMDFPITIDANQTTFKGSVDGFILKLNETGSKLNYSTFMGGGMEDVALDISVDNLGYAYVTGVTNSLNFPVTSGANDTSFNGFQDVFALKLDPYGTKLIYSTFIGGNQSEYGVGIEVDQNGNAYISGATVSIDFPNTTGAHNNVYSGGDYDCFALKLNFDGSTILYSTYLGGIYDDQCSSIEIDSLGNAYLTGKTNSFDFPTSIHAINSTINGDYDVFVTKLNQTGSKLLFSTFMGGSNYDWGNDICIDKIGNVYIVGETKSVDFPTSPNAYDAAYYNNTEVFVFQLNNDGSKMNYSTYITGIWNEFGRGITIDSKNNIYLTGRTYSPDFPTTISAFNTSHNGQSDVFLIKFSFKPIINITSLSILKNDKPIDIVYTHYGLYTFRVNISDSASKFDINNVSLTFDNIGSNIILYWSRSSENFFKINDPNNFIIIDSSSRIYSTTSSNLSLEFNLTFNWTFPNENLIEVKANVISELLGQIGNNKSNQFRVENDLMFNGTLLVTGEDNRSINNYDLVRADEHIFWTGLTLVYEGTTDIHPPDDEFNVTIWDEDGNYWLDSPETGEPFQIKITTPNKTDIDGYNYTINLTEIPPECDKTNTTFLIKVDGDNITFSNPWPDHNVWQTRSEVFLGVTITDHGGGYVDNDSVMNCVSMDNGETWSDWEAVTVWNALESINVQDFQNFDEGADNLIKWLACDSVGNGPVESETYRILVDTKNVTFGEEYPDAETVSSSGNVHVGITISDATSGINASTVKYSISFDNGSTWSIWKAVSDLNNANNITIDLNLKFPNGTGNRIRWRAYDLAGNGPAISHEYVIMVNQPKQPIIPVVQLISPANESEISKQSVTLSWVLLNKSLTDVKYDVYLDTIYPPVKIEQENNDEMDLDISNLENGQIYYWTVIPQLGNMDGTCLSGIWWFKLEIPIPMVTLISPINGSSIPFTSPTLQWKVDYTGIEIPAYDILFGTKDNFSLKYEQYSSTHFVPGKILKDEITYYWQIIPWAGELKGPTSELWSFTVKLLETPSYDLDLYISPSNVTLYPGNETTISAFVKNIGELTDNISLNATIQDETTIIFNIVNSSLVTLGSEETKEFNIFFQLPTDIEPGIILVDIVAKSEKAKEVGLTVTKNTTFEIRILELERIDDDKTTEDQWWIIILIITIIMILICIFFYYKKPKKSIGDEPSEAEKAQEVINEITKPKQTPELLDKTESDQPNPSKKNE